METLLPGDANEDGRVDINDLTAVLANYDASGMTWFNDAFTGDGTVDINDLTIVLANYNTSVGSPPPELPPCRSLARSACWLRDCSACSATHGGNGRKKKDVVPIASKDVSIAHVLSR